MSGEAKVGFGLMPVSLPQAKIGKVKVYAITSAKRFAGAPDIPTMAEAGLPGFDSDELWFGMFAPARTPAALITKLNGDIVEILQTPAMREALLVQGLAAGYAAPTSASSLRHRVTSSLASLPQPLRPAREHPDPVQPSRAVMYTVPLPGPENATLVGLRGTGILPRYWPARSNIWTPVTSSLDASVAVDRHFVGAAVFARLDVASRGNTRLPPRLPSGLTSNTNTSCPPCRPRAACGRPA